MQRVRAAVHALVGTHERRVLSLLLLVLALDYADRTLVSALGPTLKHVFTLDNFKFGLLLTAFAVVGAGATIPLGILTDKTNRTILLALSLVVWSVAVGVVGAAVSFAMLLGVRLLLGAVAAASGPTTPSLTGDVVPVGQRGKARGFIDSGQLVGAGVGFVLPVIVLAFLSWRWCFWILALGGAALALGFFRVREPERTGAAGPEGDDQEDAASGVSRVRELVKERGIQPSERALVREPPTELSMWDAAKYVVRVRTDLIVLIARTIGDFFFQGISLFAVVFASQWYGISQSEAEIAVLIVGVGALAGVLLVGRLSDALLRRGHLNSRVWLGGLGYLLAPAALYPAFLTHSLAVALPLFAVGAFLLAGAAPPLDAVTIDVLVPRLRGRAESVRQVLRTLAEGGAPALIGFLGDRLAGGGAAGLELTFLIVLPALVLDGLITLLALRTYQPDVAAALASAKQREEASDQPRQRDARATA